MHKHSHKAFSDWYQTSLGQLLAQTELDQLNDLLPDMFGYHLLQIGVHGSTALCQASRISHQIRLETELQLTAGIYAHASRLPFASESIDVCVLSHSLEFDEDPHAILREIDRVLIPEGHVVLLGFNPVSWWGLNHFLRGWRKQLPWSGKFYTRARVKDWLSVLGFDCIDTGGIFFRPPVQHEKVMQKLAFMEEYIPAWLNFFAGVYIITARKRTSTLTPIGPRWRTAGKKIINNGLVEPSARGIHSDRTS